MSTTNEPACYLLIRKAACLLFVFRENTGYFDGYYSLPAGRVEQAETYRAGAVREAEEEVGLVIPESALRHVYTGHRLGADGVIRSDVYFVAIAWSGEPVNAEPDKHSAIAWLAVDDLPENVMDYQRIALRQIAGGQTYGEFGWSDRS